MHRILTLWLAFVLCVAANAQGLNVKGHLADLAGNIIPASAAAPATSAQHRAGENIIQQFPYLLGAFYEKLSDSLADYYILCSSVAGQYNASTGAVTAPNGMLVRQSLSCRLRPLRSTCASRSSRPWQHHRTARSEPSHRQVEGILRPFFVTFRLQNLHISTECRNFAHNSLAYRPHNL